MTFKHTFEDQTLKQLAYQNEQLKIALGTDEQKPIEYTGDLTVTQIKKYPDGTVLYDVSYDVTDKNTSKSLIHVTYTSAELYLGDTSAREPAFGAAFSINDAPDPWHPQDSGLISWRRIAYEANVDDGPTNPTVMKWMHDHGYTSISHGGLTGTLSSGTSNEYMPEFLIRAKPSQYVDVVVSFGVDDSLDVASPNVGLVDDSLWLVNAETDKHDDAAAKSGPHTHGSTKSHNRALLAQRRRTPT
ncbi:hypothetical protein M0D69_04680 [Caballeronia sp. SEWSISQ10-4 2]|uniref:hypothetical protein n=1 Tax=Caballeronia sp. SEWSISQ10-4 2 TaxID=2937438 RepID=UPI002651DB39|nr:hypothetical protein [Caballeronia sp. SEWSISQ10-4 2]MDN7177319.1 hypothetical protein [Caballeronia sp. SEWSISQ10-4 2]